MGFNGRYLAETVVASIQNNESCALTVNTCKQRDKETKRQKEKKTEWAKNNYLYNLSSRLLINGRIEGATKYICHEENTFCVPILLS